MSPAAFFDAAAAWALAPGFRRARDGERPSVTAGGDGAAGDVDRRHHWSDPRTSRDNPQGPAGAGATGAHPSDHARRHVTDESEAA